MDWKYIAGFVDGEGSITKTEKRGRLFVSQTNLEVLQQIKTFSGYGNIFQISKRQKHWKDAWVYAVTDKYELCAFLKAIRPHLIVKKEQACIAIQELEGRIESEKKRLEKKHKVSLAIKELRKQGHTYRSIGRILKVDWGYVRKLELGLK